MIKKFLILLSFACLFMSGTPIEYDKLVIHFETFNAETDVLKSIHHLPYTKVWQDEFGLNDIRFLKYAELPVKKAELKISLIQGNLEEIMLYFPKKTSKEKLIQLISKEMGESKKKDEEDENSDYKWENGKKKITLSSYSDKLTLKIHFEYPKDTF